MIALYGVDHVAPAALRSLSRAEPPAGPAIVPRWLPRPAMGEIG